ncbi:MAG: cell surface protein SprA [Bacteroidales bacterium]|nr:cell surface protein SprA [Bacteroidales bacterium]
MLRKFFLGFAILSLVGIIIPSFAIYLNLDIESFLRQSEVNEVDEVTDTVKAESGGEPVQLPYPIESKPEYPDNYTQPKSGIRLSEPPNLSTKFEFNPETNEYTATERIGAFEMNTPYTMTSEEYHAYIKEKNKSDYWRLRSKGQRSGDNSAYQPELNLQKDIMDKLLGNSPVEIIPQGAIDLTFGYKINNNNNPALTKKEQRTSNFDIDSKIQLSVTGKVGDKVSLTLKYDNEAQFEFDNKMKLEYTGEEDDIIQKFEAGNVSFPLSTSLITGSQSLFGFKTDLQFGKLKFSGVFSRQQGESSVIQVDGGAQVKEFEVRCDEYDKNRHFFLDMYFRQEYENGFRNMPLIDNGIEIIDVQVWISSAANYSINKEDRDIVAIAQLGEIDTTINGQRKYALPRNSSAIVDKIAKQTSIRSGTIDNLYFETVSSAILLSPNEYTVNTKLGYISLRSALKEKRVLAVSYKYMYKGKQYSVGYSSEETEGKIIMKLLSPYDLDSGVNWDLMMKNVYSLRGYQLSQEDFDLGIYYEDDKTGTALPYLPEGVIKGVNFLQVLKCDRTTSDLQPYADGFYDFVEGFTINASRGIVFLPVLEPFGSSLREAIGDDVTADKYVYEELYDSSLSKAQQVVEKNKFVLKGTYKSSSSSRIRLNSSQVTPGSVVVTCGGVTLIEDEDYIVDYAMGELEITNASYTESGNPIQVKSESNPLFSIRSKTLYGGRFDYRVNQNTNLGFTVLHLSEVPVAHKVGFDDFPVKNTIWGIDGTYSTKLPFLTKFVDRLPLIETKEESNIKLAGEFAQLVPGVSDKISDAIEIDYFDNTERPTSLKEPRAWSIASIPQGQRMFPEGQLNNSLTIGNNRALISWYDINNTFYRSNSSVSDDIISDPFSRPVHKEDLFPENDEDNPLNQSMSLLDIAYYPKERGPYNFDVRGVSGYSAGIDPSTGALRSPRTRWAGIMRTLSSADFEKDGVEYIEFWLMDPFVKDANGTHTGGDLYINLGKISEDVVKDDVLFDESNMKADPQTWKTSIWGRVPLHDDKLTGFNTNENRLVQDVGFDGMSSVAEANYHRSFLNEINAFVSNITEKQKIAGDPSSDDFSSYNDDRGYEGGDLVWRYKYYWGLEGNSSSELSEGAGQIYPNTEDLNKDNNIQTQEAYHQYKISLRPQDLVVGENFIVDMRTENVKKLANGDPASTEWYQFKIPVRTNNREVINGISGFSEIEFIRMFLHNFEDSVVLRFAEFNIVKSDWRKYTKPIYEEGDYDLFNDSEFEMSSVNIEENSNRIPVNYVLPPGVNRVVDPMNTSYSMLNETALQVKIEDLEDGNAQAVFKTVNKDLRQFGRLEMFCHAEALINQENLLEDGDLKAFIRIGSDYSENYYEYEIPLELTPHNNYDAASSLDRLAVWPLGNNFDINLDDFVELKKERNEVLRNGVYRDLEATDRYTISDKSNINKKLTIKGYPNLGNVKVIMLGVKNPKRSTVNNNDDGIDKSGIVWFNELRLSEMNNKGGWAALASAKVNFADFAVVSLSGKTSKPGFGSIDQQSFARSQDDIIQYDFASGVSLHKLLPEQLGLSIPFFFDFSEMFVTPLYDPTNPDILLKDSYNEFDTEKERDSLKELTREYVQRKSYNFTNIKMQRPNSKPSFYNISNFSTTYAYTQYLAYDIRTARDYEYTHKFLFDYSYSGRPKNFEPFKKMSAKYVTLLKDFNFYLFPSQISIKNSWDRKYRETQRRNLNSTTDLPILASKNFNWSRDYNLVYNLSKNLKISYSAQNLSRIDEPQGVVDKANDVMWKAYKTEVWDNFKTFGTNMRFNQNVSLSYKLPFEKIKIIDWISSDYKYSGTYQWEKGPELRPDDMGMIEFVGNNIKNSNTQSLDNTLALTKLYNKSKYLKSVNQKFGKAKKKSEVKTETVNFNKDKIDLTANKPYHVNHKLKTTDVKVTFFDDKGKVAQGQTEVISDNKIIFTPEQDYKNANVAIQGKREKSNSVMKDVLDGTVYVLMMTKSVTVNWKTSRGSFIPGYTYETDNFGLNKPFSSPTPQPGLPYVFGWVDNDLESQLETSDWIMYKPDLISDMFSRTNTNDLNVSATLQPLRSMKISLSANRSFSENYNQYMVAETDAERDINRKNATTGGSYLISINSISSAFDPEAAYQKFRDNRLIIANRLATERLGENNYELDPETGFPILFKENSQDVLIPAFLSAYTGTNINNIKTDEFFIPLFAGFKEFLTKLNWRLSYNGLSNLAFIKKFATSVNINHGYKSTYTIGNYENFNSANMLDNGLYVDVEDYNLFYAPKYNISNVSISEAFSPLVGVEVKWKGNFTSKFDITNNRNVSLSFVNTEITETGGMGVVVGLGYVFKDFVINIKTQGSKKEYKNDLTIRADISLRDNSTVRRIIEDDITLNVSGAKVWGVKTSADYMLTERFKVKLFCDYNNNVPVIGYSSSNWYFGINIRFSLTE